MENVRASPFKEVVQESSKEKTKVEGSSISQKLDRMFDQAKKDLTDKNEHVLLLDEDLASELVTQTLQASVEKEGVNFKDLSANVGFTDGKVEVSVEGSFQGVRKVKGKEIRGIKRKVKAAFRFLNSRDEYLGDVVAFDVRSKPGIAGQSLGREIRGNELSKKMRD